MLQTYEWREMDKDQLKSKFLSALEGKASTAMLTFDENMTNSGTPATVEGLTRQFHILFAYEHSKEALYRRFRSISFGQTSGIGADTDLSAAFGGGSV